MLVLSLVSLAIASISIFIFLNVQEDVVRPCFAVTAAFALFLTLCLAPWALKLTLVAIPIALERLYGGAV
ncbi:MAG: riboflavin synthase subunit alpha [Snowella sp.]|nr:riboflavin synthase subunit alpha [Snowella sp.]